MEVFFAVVDSFATDNDSFHLMEHWSELMPKFCSDPHVWLLWLDCRTKVDHLGSNNLPNVAFADFVAAAVRILFHC